MQGKIVQIAQKRFYFAMNSTGAGEINWGLFCLGLLAKGWMLSILISRSLQIFPLLGNEEDFFFVQNLIEKCMKIVNKVAISRQDVVCFDAKALKIVQFYGHEFAPFFSESFARKKWAFFSFAIMNKHFFNGTMTFLFSATFKEYLKKIRLNGISTQPVINGTTRGSRQDV